MNESNLNPPPPLPPSLPADELPLGEHPHDCNPIVGALGVIEAVLRHPRRIVFHLNQGSATGRLVGLLLAVALALARALALALARLSAAFRAACSGGLRR